MPQPPCLRRPTVGLVLVLLLWVPAVRAGAQDEPPPDPPPDSTTVWQNPTLVITATAPGTLRLTDTPGAPSSGPRYYCAWFSLRPTRDGIDAIRVSNPTVGDTYAFNCWFTHPWTDQYPGYPIFAVFDPVVDPPGPLITTPEVSRFALASIELERPAMITSPADVHVVGIPSWFAVESALDYAPASAQAGPVWATVRPVFRDVVWTFANGDRLVCVNDATTQWHADGPETQHSECSHTFRSAPGEPTPTSARVHWDVWQRTDRTAGAWEHWGVVSLATTVDLSVVDLQAAIN